MKTMVNWVTETASSDFQVISGCHMLASLVNKKAGGEWPLSRTEYAHSPSLIATPITELGELLEQVENELWKTSSDPGPSAGRWRRALVAWIWVCRSFIKANVEICLNILRYNVAFKSSPSAEPLFRLADDLPGV